MTGFLLGMIFGMVAALMLNIGKGVQKQKVHVFLQGRRMFAPPHRREFAIWLLGFVITVGASLPYAIGLKLSGSPSTISAMTGVGLIGLVVYAWKVIGETIRPADAFGIALVVIGTTFLGYHNAGRVVVEREVASHSMIGVIAFLMLAAVGGCLLALVVRRIHGLVFGATAGACVGIALCCGDVALLRSEVGQPIGLLLAGAIAFSLLATLTTQLGFLRGRAVEVVPAVNSAIVLTPLFLEVVVYHQMPPPATLAFIGIILVAVLLLSRGAAAQAA